jgi:hypothetical protein
MNEETATQIRDLAFEISEKISLALRKIKDNVSDNEFENFNTAAYKIADEIYLSLLYPIYEQYPFLRPQVDEGTEKIELQLLVDAMVAKGMPMSDETLEAIAKYALTIPNPHDTDD